MQRQDTVATGSGMPESLAPAFLLQLRWFPHWLPSALGLSREEHFRCDELDPGPLHFGKSAFPAAGCESADRIRHKDRLDSEASQARTRMPDAVLGGDAEHYRALRQGPDQPLSHRVRKNVQRLFLENHLLVFPDEFENVSVHDPVFDGDRTREQRLVDLLLPFGSLDAVGRKLPEFRIVRADETIVMPCLRAKSKRRRSLGMIRSAPGT
jgi:hypothetical protein